jgi:murein tripeptide amidase MpaA
MAKQEAPLHQLKDYLPEGSFEAVSQYLLLYKVQLTITRERKSVLGDYRNSLAGVDLNRQWINPEPEFYPEVFGVKNMI